jgi:predicted RNase H-like HicB family nuclease
MPDYKFTVVAERDEDGLYVASVPFLQGCYTQGATYEEALENIKDAIKLHIEARRALGEPMADGQQCQYTKVEIWGRVY